jgi:hypothetical protein
MRRAGYIQQHPAISAFASAFSISGHGRRNCAQASGTASSRLCNGFAKDANASFCDLNAQSFCPTTQVMLPNT